MRFSLLKHLKDSTFSYVQGELTGAAISAAVLEAPIWLIVAAVTA